MKIAGIILIFLGLYSFLTQLTTGAFDGMDFPYILGSVVIDLLLIWGGVALLIRAKAKDRMQLKHNYSMILTSTIKNEKPHAGRQVSRFCKRCGSQIDPETKKCTGCGKQYPYFSEKLFWRVFTPVICIVLAIVIILQYNNNQLWINAYNDQQDRITKQAQKIEDQEDTISIYESDINDKLSKISALEQGNEELRDKTNFMDYYIVIVGADEKYYHKYGCPRLNKSTFLAFNIDAAKGEGYKPCPYCCE